MKQDSVHTSPEVTIEQSGEQKMALTELEASPVKGATTIETKPEVGGLGEDVEESPYKEDTEEYEEVESEIGVAEEKQESPV